MNRTKKVRALYSLIGIANRAKDIGDYKLSNLTFGLGMAFLENDEFKIVYEDAGNELSAYYDVITIFLNGRGLCIPAPLLSKDALSECLKRADSRIELLEHNRQYRQLDPVEWRHAFNIIVSRYLKLLKAYFSDEVIETALWMLDIPKGQKEAFDQWCSDFLKLTGDI